VKETGYAVRGGRTWLFAGESTIGLKFNQGIVFGMGVDTQFPVYVGRTSAKGYDPLNSFLMEAGYFKANKPLALLQVAKRIGENGTYEQLNLVTTFG
jgi:hypothetical protein